MAFVPAKCTQCGAAIEVDESKDAGICKYCGTPFVTEKAINNYNTYVTNNFEGANINVLGSDINNLLSLSQSALEASNFQEAYDYANKVLEIDMNSSSAWVCKMQAVAGLTTVKSPRIDEIVNCGIKAITTDKETQSETKNKIYNLWLDFANNMMNLAIKQAADISVIAPMIATADAKKQNEAQIIDNAFRNELAEFVGASINLAIKIPEEELHYGFDSKYIQLANAYLQYCSNDVKRLKLFLSKLKPSALEARQKNLNLITKRIPCNLHNKITGEPLSRGKRCYIATAVYGTYDCPELWTLRRFRDLFLEEYYWGRVFIKLYYLISPSICVLFKNNTLFNRSSKYLLNRFVKCLNKRGYANTSYKDF